MHFGGTLSHLWKTLPSASGAGHIGETDRWELMMDRKWWRARTYWNSHLALTASNFDDAGDLQEKPALCTLQLLTHKVQDSEKQKTRFWGSWRSGQRSYCPMPGRGVSRWGQYAPVSAHMSKCGNGHALPSSFQIWQTEFSCDYLKIPSSFERQFWETKFQLN